MLGLRLDDFGNAAESVSNGLGNPSSSARVSQQPPAAQRSPFSRIGIRTLSCLAVLLISSASPSFGAGWDECERLLIHGRYSECVALATSAIEERKYGEDWPLLKAKAELATGRYAEAWTTLENGLKRYSSSVRLRLAGYHASLGLGETQRATILLEQILTLVGRSPSRYTGANDLVALGQVALLRGADARIVLEGFYDRARKYNTDHRGAYLASGELALAKNDLALAADTFQAAFKVYPDDPDVQYGLARSLTGSEPQRAAECLERALELNPQHVPSLLLKAERLIDAEEYREARGSLKRVLTIHATQPGSLALLAAVAHLQGDPAGEVESRARALQTWKTNPRVDYLIGRKLSQNYRFREGARYQRLALASDANYLPAKIQLSQDLLRLGEEAEGWELADAVYEQDGYDVVTFNLVELRDKLEHFRTLESADFIVRMDAEEADIYGERVLRLLQRAKAELCSKYGAELSQQIIVEIFPDQNDFAVRTFGMPAVSGYLGVCFGRVITANSPAGQQEHPSNWESVLWHEFCHVVTLEMTHNRIPRWLSEGISVYEELQKNPQWGQRMTPRYRSQILEEGLTPIGEMSSAFLNAESSWHVQFAYYQSTLAVEFLVTHYGQEALLAILHDLREGLNVNEALERRTAPLAELEEQFEVFARRQANALADEADWTKHDLSAVLNDDNRDRIAEWVAEHANNIPALTIYAERLMADADWVRAKSVLRRLIELYPEYAGGDNPYERLAGVHRELGETAQEREILRRYLKVDAAALRAGLRLLELDRDANDWAAVSETVGYLLAINPLLPQPHRALAEAAEALGDDEVSIETYRTLLAMEPADPAVLHFRLAVLLHARRDPAARKHVLLALEEAPRFREAHTLLLQMVRETHGETHSEP